MSVAADDTVRTPRDRAFEHAIIVGVVGDHIEPDEWLDHMGNAGK